MYTWILVFFLAGRPLPGVLTGFGNQDACITAMRYVQQPGGAGIGEPAASKASCIRVHASTNDTVESNPEIRQAVVKATARLNPQFQAPVSAQDTTQPPHWVLLAFIVGFPVQPIIHIGFASQADCFAAGRSPRANYAWQRGRAIRNTVCIPVPANADRETIWQAVRYEIISEANARRAMEDVDPSQSFYQELLDKSDGH